MFKKVIVAALTCSTLMPLANAQDLKSRVYGYLEGYVEKNEKTPTRTGGTASTPGTVSREVSPHEFDTPNIVLMVKSTYQNKFSSFLNLVSPGGEEVRTRNAWIETKIAGEQFKIRFGKMYRPFGLYNEILDAVPTFIGIEPPELFDADHLIVTRTTNLMFHGEQEVGQDLLRYAITTGNDEVESDQIPVGGDVRYTHFGNGYDLTFGSSFYLSNGKAVPHEENAGGVKKWMKEDEYNVLGFYSELNTNKWKVQGAYYKSHHNGTRSGEFLRENFGADSALNQRQLDRLCQGNCATATDSSATYDVETWYFRAGYTIQTEYGDWVPYVQYDYYSNPETIANKDIGGDNEAGLADDGRFTKQTLGLVYRPVPVAAIKLDASNHNQKIDGSYKNFTEARLSYSYIWSL